MPFSPSISSTLCGSRASCVAGESVLTVSVLPAHRQPILSWRFTLRGLFLLGLG